MGSAASVEPFEPFTSVRVVLQGLEPRLNALGSDAKELRPRLELALKLWPSSNRGGAGDERSMEALQELFEGCLERAKDQLTVASAELLCEAIALACTAELQCVQKLDDLAATIMAPWTQRT